MSKEMIVSVNGREKKIAILENGKVAEFYIERGEENSGVVGNVYKGRVMRVLPGMQSAFVDIGLERDAFLYVTDFFDEEEEIERIVTEKGKKQTPEQARKAADDQIDLSRAEREKQMEAAQEVAEPLVEAAPDEMPAFDEAPGEPAEEAPAEKPKRGRGRKAKAEPKPEVVESEPVFEIEYDAAGFERVSDDDETAGDMFKDAYVQEQIIDKVRAVEFDMESTAEAEVGSLLSDVTDGSGFERIADEEEESAPAKKTRAKRTTKAAEKEKEKKAAKPKPKSPAKRAAVSHGKFSKKRSTKPSDTLEDAEASEKAPSDIAEMAVRRGGRGRKRTTKKDEVTDENLDSQEAPESTAEPAEAQSEEPRSEAASANGPDETGDGGSNDRSARGRERGRRGGRGRGERGERSDRQNGRGGRYDRRDRPPAPAISDLLKEGQEILVQIAKEPIAKKGARITSHIALPGRYLVYMPTIEHLGVSRKIESSNERSRLRQTIQRIRQDPEITSGGFIVRTAGIGVPEEDLKNDAKYLARMWSDAKKDSEKKKSPALIHKDLDLIQRILRDQLADDFTAIRIDSEEEYQRTVEFINLIQPRLVNRIKLYTRDEPILDYYGVQDEIDKALKPRVWLRSGGYLVINQTEALVSIDVNTGKFVGKGNQRLEDTITRTNMEAVEEIARQIRLRDLGGIIVLDLIDMEDRRNRHKVSQALQEALARDKSPTKVLSFNEFGLIIMTRKRVKQSLERTMCTPCEYCEGAGWVKSPTTVCYEILAEARRLSKDLDDVRHTTLRVHPDVSKALRGEEHDVLYEIEEYLGTVDVAADSSVHPGQFDFAFV